MSVFSHMMNKEHEKIAILWKALEFYANKDSWEHRAIYRKDDQGELDVQYPPSEIDKDQGAKARKAFEEINDLPLW